MVDYAAVSKTGVRKVNEDALCAAEREGSCGFIVCDGLGGQGMGDEASRTAVRSFESFFSAFAGRMEDFLPQMFEYVQNALLRKKQSLNVRNQMCTTAAALVIDGERAFAGYIGDSRLYVFEDGHLVRRTLDHSLAQALALHGEIDEAEIAHHPDRNRLLRALGMAWDRPMYALEKPRALRENQAFLLCSDGFWEWLTDEQIERTLARSPSAAEWLSALTDIAEKSCNGAVPDNYSAIAVRYN